jgi:myo-inositol-1(or 4)-monophosphatase
LPGSEPPFNPQDRAADVARLAAAVREAGSVALSYFRGPLKSWTKGEAQSPVTEADIASNDLLHERLVNPGDGWLSEESENDPARLGARRIWVVDPIDGTRAFMAGREDWSVSVALVEAGRPVIAALFAPTTDEMFMAVVGGGATRNGAPIHANGGEGLAGARIGGPKRMLDRLAQQVPPIVPMPRVHSLALRLARVADGALDVAIAGGSGHDWDLAAADLLVHEAGGVMTALDGRVLIYNQPEPVHGVLIAGGSGRHAAVIDLIRAQTSESA